MTQHERRFFMGGIACLFAAALLAQAAAAGAATPAGPPAPESDRLCGFMHNLGVLRADLRSPSKPEQIPVGLNPTFVNSANIEPPEEPAPREPQTPPRMLGIAVGDGPALMLESSDLEPMLTVMVTAVIDDMPAEQAGVESGDLIISIDGEPPGDAASFVERARELGEGDSARLVVIREQRILVFDITPAPTPDWLEQRPPEPESRADAFEDVLAALSDVHSGLWVDSDGFETETIVSAIDALTQVRTAAAMLHLLDALPPERAEASREAILEEATARLHEAGARLGIMVHDRALPPRKVGAIERTRDAIGVFRRLADVDPKQADRRRHWRTRQLVDSFIYDRRDAGAGTITAAIGLREQEQLERAEFASDQHRIDFFEAIHDDWLGMEWQEAELWRRLVEGDTAEPDPADPDASDRDHD